MKNKLNEPERRSVLEKLRLFIEDFMKEGYGGVLPNGRIVDRRVHPEAAPLQENPLLGIAKPKEVEDESKS